MYMYVYYYNLIYSQSHIFKHVCEAALLMYRYIINTLSYVLLRIPAQ